MQPIHYASFEAANLIKRLKTHNGERSKLQPVLVFLCPISCKHEIKLSVKSLKFLDFTHIWMLQLAYNTKFKHFFRKKFENVRFHAHLSQIFGCRNLRVLSGKFCITNPAVGNFFLLTLISLTEVQQTLEWSKIFKKVKVFLFLSEFGEFGEFGEFPSYDVFPYFLISILWCKPIIWTKY